MRFDFSFSCSFVHSFVHHEAPALPGTEERILTQQQLLLFRKFSSVFKNGASCHTYSSFDG